MTTANDIDSAVDAFIAADARAVADVQHFREGFADPNFLRDRMAELFAPGIRPEYRTGYCRAIQKTLERSA